MIIRRNFIAGVVAGLAVILTGIAPLYAADPIATGLWEQTDDSGKVGGWFLLFERDGLFQGALVRSFPQPGETPLLVCAKCTDERKNAPMMGLIIIKDMQRKGLAYDNGTILDPRDGSIYKAKLDLSPDGKNLTVRGFIGIELFGQSQVWRRLPDNALARNEIPESVQPFLTPTAIPAPRPGNVVNPRPGPPLPLRRQ
jgi:hypothetical protein